MEKIPSNIPYKTYLNEHDLPKAWYNIRVDMKKKGIDINPLLNPGTMQPVTLDELSHIFCTELAKQELDNTNQYIEIPEEVQNFYKMYRPSPIVRAYCLEKVLGTPAKIYYKFEGNNTSGSHKLNSAIAQAYYAKAQGITNITTETGAGQWGTALSMACGYFGLDLLVYMVRCSAQSKPMRKTLMETYGATVIESPSTTTKVGQAMLDASPDNYTGSLGTAISEAVEIAVTKPNTRYELGSVLNQVLLHQSIIGIESKLALDSIDEYPDEIIGCIGGGSNFGGLIAEYMHDKLDGKGNAHFIAVEPESCPSCTKGEFRYDFCDTGKVTPLAEMYTLGYDFMPAPTHAGGLRYHGMSPIISKLIKEGYVDDVRAVDQVSVFAAAEQFARCEGILPAPESAHAIKVAIDEALKCKESGETKTILFGLTGTGYFDLYAYDKFNKHTLTGSN